MKTFKPKTVRTFDKDSARAKCTQMNSHSQCIVAMPMPFGNAYCIELYDKARMYLGRVRT